MIIREHKKVSTTVIYNENFLILEPTIIGCASVSDFCFLVGTPVLITSSAIKLKTFSVAAGIKKHKLIINKKRKKHDKIVLLAESKLNSIELLIFMALIDSVISHN